MRGWIELCSDVNWEDYHGMWAKKAKDGSWYVLRWTNMYDACGEGECKRDGIDQYECEVKRLDLRELTDEQKVSACSSYGLLYKAKGDDFDLVDSGEPIDDKFKERALVEACISYGFGAPLHTETGDKRPRNVRATARRFAEECIRDAAKLEAQLEQPVNALGSTAAEYGRGDFLSAQKRGPFDTAKNLMRKLSGLPEKKE